LNLDVYKIKQYSLVTVSNFETFGTPLEFGAILARSAAGRTSQWNLVWHYSSLQNSISSQQVKFSALSINSKFHGKNHFYKELNASSVYFIAYSPTKRQQIHLFQGHLVFV
jgi:hypothetical protein